MLIYFLYFILKTPIFYLVKFYNREKFLHGAPGPTNLGRPPLSQRQKLGRPGLVNLDSRPICV